MAKWVFLNNEFIEEERAFIHFKDLAFQRGYGIFDFFRIMGNEPLFLEDHLDRFYFSAEEMHLPVSLQREELKIAVFELIKRNNLPHSGIRLSLSGGPSEEGFAIGRPNLLISQQTLVPPTAEQFQNGVKLLTYPHQRQLPHVKTIDYLMAIWLQPKRIEHGADDILYHHNGFISECPRSNFFLVTAENSLITPAENVLAGITRKNILQLAKQHFDVEERNISLNELKTAREAFITSTTKHILPIAQVDAFPFSERKISQQLLQLFRSTFVKE